MQNESNLNQVVEVVEVVKAQVGSPAPDFDMASTANIKTLAQNVKLSDYSGKWLVMLFYPLDFTFVCPTELTAFSDRYEEFQGIGADIILSLIHISEPTRLLSIS